MAPALKVSDAAMTTLLFLSKGAEDYLRALSVLEESAIENSGEEMKKIKRVTKPDLEILQ